MIELRPESQAESSNIREAYNKIMNSGEFERRDSYYLWILHLLDPDMEDILIDISCGQGKLVSLAHSQGYRAFGLDFSERGLKVASERGPVEVWVHGDGEHLPLADNAADLVANLGSIEHYQNPSLGAEEIARVLKADGIGCILLPNSYGLFGNILYVGRHGDVFDDGQPLQRYATLSYWSEMLSRSGLRIERVLKYSEIDFPRTQEDLLWLMRHPVKILRALLHKLIPLTLSSQFAFIVTTQKTHTR